MVGVVFELVQLNPNTLVETLMPFTQNWFEEQKAPWIEYIVPALAGKPNLNFIEVGSYEGSSALWMCENILVSDDCVLTCIDTFQGSMEIPYDSTLLGRFRENTKKHERKIRVIVDHSFNALRGLVSKSGGPDPEPVFDLAFIDGSHVARDVLTDALLLWPYIKPGGYMVFDDYEWDVYSQAMFCPKIAIDAFVAVCSHELTISYKGLQLFVQKRLEIIETPEINPRYRAV
jgi:predicted O-methyltransferase YrrM